MLAWQIFLEYESPEYSEEGTEEFRRCLKGEKYVKGIAYYGAFGEKRLIGVVGIRSKNQHICFSLFTGGLPQTRHRNKDIWMPD
mgnify:CR=1 FL=1